MGTKILILKLVHSFPTTVTRPSQIAAHRFHLYACLPMWLLLLQLSVSQGTRKSCNHIDWRILFGFYGVLPWGLPCNTYKSQGNLNYIDVFNISYVSPCEYIFTIWYAQPYAHMFTPKHYTRWSVGPFTPLRLKRILIYELHSVEEGHDLKWLSRFGHVQRSKN